MFDKNKIYNNLQVLINQNLMPEGQYQHLYFNNDPELWAMHGPGGVFFAPTETLKIIEKSGMKPTVIFGVDDGGRLVHPLFSGSSRAERRRNRRKN
jgi:hypothetical protein